MDCSGEDKKDLITLGQKSAKEEHSEKVIPKTSYQKIVVVGKKSTGKSTLIEGCEKNDLGKENIEAAFSTVAKLAADGMTHMLYCVSGETGKVEDAEKELIMRAKRTFPSITVSN